MKLVGFFFTPVENHISVKSEDDCGSSLRLSHGRISFVWGKPGVWRSLSSVVSRFLLVCWASVSYQWLVDRLSIVLRLSVRCQSLVCRASYGCPSIASRSIVAGRLSTVADHFSEYVSVICRLSVDLRSVLWNFSSIFTNKLIVSPPYLVA